MFWQHWISITPQSEMIRVRELTVKCDGFYDPLQELISSHNVEEMDSIQIAVRESAPDGAGKQHLQNMSLILPGYSFGLIWFNPL